MIPEFLYYKIKLNYSCKDKINGATLATEKKQIPNYIPKFIKQLNTVKIFLFQMLKLKDAFRY